MNTHLFKLLARAPWDAAANRETLVATLSLP